LHDLDVPELPTGSVTLLFTDIEGSTRLLQELGERYAEALAEHRRRLREAFRRHGGVEVDTQGDAFCYAFASAKKAIAAADAAQAALSEGPIQVRIGIHTGEPQLTDEGYVGIDVHKAARICSTAHGGQVVISDRTRALLDGGPRLTDLGLHRLKDLGRPEKLFQLGDHEFPPLRSLNATNLPTQATPLVGREREVEEVTALVRDRARLVTLTGSGGTGKTRLALQVAAELVEEFEDGVFWVPLASLMDPELVLPTVARTVGAKVGLAEHIDEKHTLLLLDNFEQILDAAPALGELIRGCPNLRLVVTSRALLHVRGEREYPVLPLPEQDALTLFRERAADAEPAEVVLEICRRLDGLPLAIELAAARTRVLSPEQLLERLAKRLPLLTGGPRDAPARQQTLRATIEWSHELLSPDEQALFLRLAVFAGGCTLEAAEAVCEADLDTLQSLVEKSLVRKTGERFWLLETIREFAFQCLEESGEAASVGRRHAEHFLGLAEEAAPHLDNPPEQRRWLARLDAELDNFRTALAWSSDRDDSEVGLRLAASLREFWFVRGYYSEGLRWLDSLLSGGVVRAPEFRLRALEAGAGLALKVSEFDVAHQYAEEALIRARDADDRVAAARALLALGSVARIAGDGERRDAFYLEGLALARDAGDLVLAARFLASFGTAALEAGDFERAGSFYRESLALSEAADSEQGIARAHGFLASHALHEGRVEDALVHSRRSLELAHRLGWMEAVVYQLGTLACAYALLGEAERAAKLVGAESSLVDELHLRLERHYRDERERAATEVRRQLDAERLDRLLAEGRAISLDDAVQLALSADA